METPPLLLCHSGVWESITIMIYYGGGRVNRNVLHALVMSASGGVASP